MTWKPGQSGNPDGRSAGAISVERQLRLKYEADIPKLVEVLRDLALGLVPSGYEKAEIKTSDRVKAGAEVLDRLLGKARQAIEGTLDLGASPEQLALLAALQMTPQERRLKLAAIDAEDAAAALEGPPVDADDDPAA